MEEQSELSAFEMEVFVALEQALKHFNTPKPSPYVLVPLDHPVVKVLEANPKLLDLKRVLTANDMYEMKKPFVKAMNVHIAKTLGRTPSEKLEETAKLFNVKIVWQQQPL